MRVVQSNTVNAGRRAAMAQALAADGCLSALQLPAGTRA